MTVLDQICADKRRHVDARKSQMPLATLETMVEGLPPTRGFINALKQKNPALIAEVKKASPSKGIIRENFNPVKIAKTYEENGAACLSVLTDEPYFQGSDNDLIAVRNDVSLPILRKDFMIDPYQIYESRMMGADCILLIMAALSDDDAKDLYNLATHLSLDSLFEVHDEEELNRALALNPQMVGVNNRNLKTLDVNLETGLRLGTLMPDTILKVAESGIDSTTMPRFQSAGFNAYLIGESLLREKNLATATQKILSSF